MKEKIISLIYFFYGLIDIAIFFHSFFVLSHIFILGAICLATGVGIWLKKAWLIYLAIFAGPLTFIFGIVTLYSSILLVGFSPDMQILLFHLFLVGYSIISLGLFVYTLAIRSTLHKS